ncbi:hypothetical protein [Agrobacterium vitis]|uniref:hypothetical protein n=1 Tax=Agrobacterium vitis TaxID=373 RepID=UPI0018D23243|nr:hypothetical protein [Agrobacterium vitis]
MTSEKPIWVESEWGELKECVYGSPDAWVLPKFLSDSKLRAQGEFGEFWAENQGRNVAEAAPKIFAEMNSQVNGAIRTLESLGVKVHVAGVISEKNRLFPRGEDHGVSTPWLRDPFVTIGNSVIELAPRSLFSSPPAVCRTRDPGTDYGSRRPLFRPARQRRRRLCRCARLGLSRGRRCLRA